MGKSKTKAVIYWPESEQVSVEELSKINEEDRYRDALTTIRSGGKNLRAVVKFISGDERKLQEEENKALMEVEEMTKSREAAQLGGERKTRSRRSAPAVPGTASSNDVASALGERLKPSAQQMEKLKKLNDSKKAAEQAQRNAQDDVDRAALNVTSVSRSLAFVSDEESNVSDSDGCVFEDSDAEDKEGNENNFDECCHHCKSLRKAYSQSGVLFIQALAKFAQSAAGSGAQYAELRPIPPGRPSCEISKGSEIFIENADKNAIKTDCGGDPSKMTRMTLVSLFGRENLEKNAITALGTKQGTLGIRKRVRDAAKQYDPLSVPAFNRVINRKKNQIHRKSPPKKSSKGSPKKLKKSPKKAGNKKKSSEKEVLSPEKAGPTTENTSVCEETANLHHEDSSVHTSRMNLNSSSSCAAVPSSIDSRPVIASPSKGWLVRGQQYSAPQGSSYQESNYYGSSYGSNFGNYSGPSFSAPAYSASHSASDHSAQEHSNASQGLHAPWFSVGNTLTSL
ncbi:Polycystic kidney disease and receptor for egg jelly-related protein [Frankliniella fusca]|uniref:Polycystic kidney disease and receptor for egg jelly-related protein n=1 Tax=Frankliniella fusca TaxID=407009 RepID=A0AAE1LP50_9NEOP|nr:Polycystic kidney disease and receptor for egg jelly-related protein [Frankliniella fusca]KAK3925207.1 Polycystic kidney disease and receptor for egg jelly-related protein [Frankliniella fusca]